MLLFDYDVCILKGYTTDDLTVVRDNLDFDEYQDSTFFDDVLVVLAKDDLEPDVFGCVQKNN